MKNIIALISIFVLALPLRAQMNMNTPELIAPSPDAAALGKYGQYPVSMSSGVVEIDIPIYTINLPLVTLPVSLSYHASGIKVDDISSMVGLGWSLNAGGTITRSVRGLPDEKFGVMGTIKDVDFIYSLNRDTKLQELSWFSNNEQSGGYDSETDIYQYNVCGLSGSFRFDSKGNLVQIPLTNNKIEFLSNNSFEITGSDGTVYTFADREEGIKTGGRRYTTSWYLSGIRTTDNKWLSFSYGTDNTIYTDYYISYKLQIGYSGSFLAADLMHNEYYTKTDNTLMLKSIEFPEGKIQFNHKSDRLDKRKYRLAGIDIKNKKNELVRAFSLEQSYFSGSDRLKLDKLVLSDSKQSQVANYSFGYNTSKQLPSYYKPMLADPSSANKPYFGQDLWGYYNGVQTNNNLLAYSFPHDYNVESSCPPANRSVNPEYAQTYILNKIIYPTGGYTEFKYESNKDQWGRNAGGLRIKNILSYAHEGSSPTIRSYEYGDIIDNILEGDLTTFYTQGKYFAYNDPGGERIKRYDYFISEPSVPMAKSSATPVFYQKVIEYDGYPENSNGKTEFHFDFRDRDSQPYFLGHCTSPFNTVNSGNPGSYILTNYYVNNTWMKGQARLIDIYTKKDSEFSLVKRTFSQYMMFDYREIKVGFRAFANITPITGYIPTIVNYGITHGETYFQYADIISRTGLLKLTQVKETDYMDGKTVTKTTTHNYERLQNQYEITSTVQTSSDGSTLKNTFEYPNDLKSTSSISKTMSERNIISPVIVKSEWANNKLVKAVQTEYKSWKYDSFQPPYRWPADLIAPYKINLNKGTGEYRTQITYNKYNDNGNIVGSTKKDNTDETIIWGYDNTFPVAKIENLSYTSASSNSTLISYLNQLQNYTVLTDLTTRNNLEALNKNIRNSLPANVKITTCTYQPLAGITSLTDWQGITTYYEYDFMGRMKEAYLMENGVKRIIENYDYHFTGQ